MQAKLEAIQLDDDRGSDEVESAVSGTKIHASLHPIGWNSVTVEELAAAYAKIPTCLRYLDLSFNSLDTVSVKQLAEAFRAIPRSAIPTLAFSKSSSLKAATSATAAASKLDLLTDEEIEALFSDDKPAKAYASAGAIELGFFAGKESDKSSALSADETFSPA